MKRPEEALQRSIVQHLEWRLEPPWMFWATANQRGTRSAVEQTILKAMGLKAGIPDIFVLGPGPVLIGLEVKAPKGVLSEAQKVMFPRLAGNGVPVIVVRDVDDVIASLSSLGAKFKGKTR